MSRIWRTLLPPDRRRHIALALACTAAPVALSLLVLYTSSTPDWSTYRVQSQGDLNDEVAYWAKARAFAKAGFGSGYFTYMERAKPAALARLGPHPQIVHVAQGSIVWLLGWHPLLPPLFNTLFLLACWLAFMRLVQPAHAGPLLFAALAFWPLALWLGTGMQTSLQIGLGIVAAGFLFRLNEEGPVSRGLCVALAAFLLAASLARFTWALLVYPCLLPLLPASLRGPRRHAAAAGIALAALLASGAFYLHFTQSYPSPHASPLDPGTLVERTSRLLANVGRNLEGLFGDFAGLAVPDPHRPRAHSAAAVASLAFALLALTGVHAAVGVWRERRLDPLAPGILALLAPVLLLVFAFYEWSFSRGERQLAGVVAMAVFLAAAACSGEKSQASRLPRRLLTVILAILVLGLPGYVSLQRHIFEQRSWDEERLDRLSRFEQFFETHLAWHPSDDPWDNTVTAHDVSDWWAALPPGLGVSLSVPIWIRNDLAASRPWSPRSFYWLTSSRLAWQLDLTSWEVLGSLDGRTLLRRRRGAATFRAPDWRALTGFPLTDRGSIEDPRFPREESVSR